MRHELWNLVENKGHCLSHLRNWISDQLKESKEILANHSDDILLRWPINDSAHSDHGDIPVSPILTAKLWVNVGVHCWNDLGTDRSRNIFECISSGDRDTILRHVIDILVIGFLVKFVETCDDNLEDTVEATLYNALSRLAYSQSALLHFGNGGPDFDRQFRWTIMLRIDQVDCELSYLRYEGQHVVIVDSDDIIEAFHDWAEHIFVVDFAGLKYLLHNIVLLLGHKEILLGDRGSTSESFHRNLGQNDLIGNHVRQNCRQNQV